MPTAEYLLEAWLCCQFQFLDDACPGRQQVMAQVHGSLLPKWETWLESSHPKFASRNCLYNVLLVFLCTSSLLLPLKFCCARCFSFCCFAEIDCPFFHSCVTTSLCMHILHSFVPLLFADFLLCEGTMLGNLYE